MGDQLEIPDVIKDLAGGISAASEVQNGYWLALAVASVFVMLPQTTNADGKATVYKLPFDLPEMGATWFAVIGVLLLSGLIVAFCAAWANLIESETLARQVLDACAPRDKDASKHVLANRYLAQQRKPSLTLVSSLWNPYEARWKVPYCVYKGLVLAAWLGLPAVALGWAVWRYVHTLYVGWMGYVFPFVVWIAASIAAVALLRAAQLEIVFFRDRSRAHIPAEDLKVKSVVDLMPFTLPTAGGPDPGPAGRPAEGDGVEE
jgi:hypothetical protein